MNTWRFMGTLFVVLLIISGCSSYSDPDTKTPVLLSLSPHDGEQDVQNSPTINAVFDEAVKYTSMILVDEGGNSVPGATTGYESETVTFTADTALSYGVTYTVTIHDVTDLSDNSLGDIIWTFRTEGTDLSAFWNQPTTPGSHDNYDGGYNSIAIDPNDGSALIAYYDTDNKAVMIMSRGRDSNLFRDNIAVDTHALPDSISLMADSAGYHVLYSNQSGEIRYAAASSLNGPWTISRVSSYDFKGILPYYEYTPYDLTYDVPPIFKIHWLAASRDADETISYSVYLAREEDLNSASITTELINAKYLQGTATDTTEYTLTAVNNNGTTIDIQQDGVYYALVMAKDASGTLLNQQYHAVKVTASDTYWVRVDQDLFTGRAYGAMELDPDGKVHITYYDYVDSALKYSTNSGTDGSFNTSIIDDGEPEDQPGRFSSIKYDTSGLSQGRLNVAYYDFHLDNDKVNESGISRNGNGNLKFAVFNSDAPTNATVWAVDTTGEVGRHSSLALTDTGTAYISYLDLTNMTIKLMNNALGTGGFFQEEVFVPRIVGETAVPIIIDPNGYIHMSYFNDCEADEQQIVDFCYATKALTNEVDQTIDAGGVGNGIENSLIYNSEDGLVNFAYHDLTDHDLRYARQQQ